MIESARAWSHVQSAFWMRKYQILVWKLECLSFCVWLSSCEYIRKERNKHNLTKSNMKFILKCCAHFIFAFAIFYVRFYLKAYHHRSINGQLIRDWSQVGDLNGFGDRYAIVHVRQANKKWLWSAKPKNGTFHRKSVSIEK